MNGDSGILKADIREENGGGDSCRDLGLSISRQYYFIKCYAN